MLPEFFTLRNWDRFCLYLNNQHSHGQMDATGGFSASNWSKTNPPRYSDCRLVMLYKVVKKLLLEFLPAEFSAFLLATQQPAELWTNGCYGWIQQVRKVQK